MRGVRSAPPAETRTSGRSAQTTTAARSLVQIPVDLGVTRNQVNCTGIRLLLERAESSCRRLPRSPPGWPAPELERRLEQVTDPGLAHEVNAWEEDADAAIEAGWAAAIEPSEEMLIRLEAKRDRILERFDLGALDAALAEIEPERRALDEAVREAIEGFEPRLPSLPAGRVDPGGGGRGRTPRARSPITTNNHRNAARSYWSPA